MRLVFHQVLKDLRLLRWLALAWIVLVAAFQSLTVFLAFAPVSHETAIRALVFTHGAIQMALVGLFAAIVVVLVQNDPAVGTTAFWFTRPLSLRVLLAGKFLVSLALLVVVPIAADLVAMVAAGLSIADAMMTIPGSLLTQAAWLLPLLAVAAITTNLGQFVCAVLGEVLIYGVTVWTVHGLVSRPRTSDSSLVNSPSLDVLVLVLAVALIVFGSVALVFAYRSRALRQAATVTAAAPVALAVLMFVWPFNLRFPAPHPGFGVARGSSQARVVQMNGGDWWLSASFRLSNVPARAVLTASRAERAWIDYPDGRVDLAITRDGARDAIPTPTLVAEFADPHSRPDEEVRFTARMPGDVFARRRNERGVLHADVAVMETETHSTFIDVRPGARYRADGRSGEIVDVSTAEAYTLTLDVRDVFISPLVTTPLSDAAWVSYVIGNPRVGIAHAPARKDPSMNLPPADVPIPAPAHLSAIRYAMDFPWANGAQAGDWLHGARLVVVQSGARHFAVVHVTIPDVTLSSLR